MEKHLFVRGMVLVFAVAMSAASMPEPSVSEFRRDDQIVKIVRAKFSESMSIQKVMNQKVDGHTKLHNLFGDPYWSRIRSIDGKLTCEKFGMVSPKWTDEEVARRAEELFAKPCS